MGWCWVFGLIIFSFPGAGQAQGWGFDARRIALGSTGTSDNLGGKMIEEQRNYSSFVLPIGLAQVFKNKDRFDPDSKQFDPITAVEYAAMPWYYVIGRDPANNPAQSAFVNDVRNATFSRDLTAYKGFVPANDFLAEGLVSPSFGKTIKVHKNGANFQGFYLGAGPYISMYSHTTISPALTTVLASGVNQNNAAFPIAETDQAQGAVAIIGGYRARYGLSTASSTGSENDGVYVAVNYNYLRGLGYNSDSLGVMIRTDQTGLVNDASNVLIDNRHSTHGTGMAVDVGVGVVVKRWEVGGGVRGIGNHLDWNTVKERTLTLASVVSGGSFVKSPTVAAADTRVELPVDYRGNAGYHGGRWSAVAEVGHGFGGTSFHGGGEFRVKFIELRGGGRYTVQKWNPAGGIGIDVSRRVSFDVAFFGTTANVERKHQAAIAASIRFNHIKKETPKA
jgi:hypothetical protein